MLWGVSLWEVVEGGENRRSTVGGVSTRSRSSFIRWLMTFSSNLRFWVESSWGGMALVEG